MESIVLDDVEKFLEETSILIEKESLSSYEDKPYISIRQYRDSGDIVVTQDFGADTERWLLDGEEREECLSDLNSYLDSWINNIVLEIYEEEESLIGLYNWGVRSPTEDSVVGNYPCYVVYKSCRNNDRDVFFDFLRGKDIANYPGVLYSDPVLFSNVDEARVALSINDVCCIDPYFVMV